MLQVEWKSSHYHSDGRRRSRPKASTVHGWLVKWRATFSGNERLRKEGIREMREAKAVRERKRQKKATRLAKAGQSRSFLCLWPVSLGNKKEQRLVRTPKVSCRRGSRNSSSHASRGGAKPKRSTSHAHSPKPVPVDSQRPGDTRRTRNGRNPPSSRKTTYNSRKDTK